MLIKKKNLTYPMLCDPALLKKNAELFFGFWGQCFNDYRTTKPHPGYEIIKSWKEIVYKKYDPKLPKPFYIYSSNVDAHFHTAGFDADEIYEIHGDIEHWQCGDPCDKTRHVPPKDLIFKIDTETMLAKDDTVMPEVDPKAEPESGILWSNNPRCLKCKYYARPHILMFGDFSCLGISSGGYYKWRTEVHKLANTKKNYNIVVLEIGAGDNVPSVRYNSDSFVEGFYYSQNVTFIRINLDLPKIKPALIDYCTPISIKSKGLEALLKIDANVKRLQSQKKEPNSITNTE